MTKAQRDINRKHRILTYAQQIQNISKTCRYFGISRQTYYDWKKIYAEKGETGLTNSKPCPENPTFRTPPEIEEKILYLRNTYHLGQLRIAMVPRTLPRHKNLLWRRLSRFKALRHERTAKEYQKADRSNPSL